MKRKKQHSPKPDSYRDRTYRGTVRSGDLASFEVRVRETDLHILASCERIERATHLILECRGQLEGYIAGHPQFLTALAPLPSDSLAPPMVKTMIEAGQKAGVGPMAAVAGAVAEFVGRKLLQEAEIAEVIVENGGDIYLARQQQCVVGIFAGISPLSNRVGIKLEASRMPLGVCTSSGTVGHSLSLGEADSVTVLARSTAVADAAATRIGNEVGRKSGIDRALAVAKTITGVEGAVVIRGEQLGAWGDVELAEL